MALSNYDYYEIARAKWIMSQKTYAQAAANYNKAYTNQIECYSELQRLAKLLSKEEQERAVREQFGS